MKSYIDIVKVKSLVSSGDLRVYLHGSVVLLEDMKSGESVKLLDIQGGSESTKVAVPHYQTWCNSDGKPVKTLRMGWECPDCGNTEISNFCSNCGVRIKYEESIDIND